MRIAHGTFLCLGLACPLWAAERLAQDTQTLDDVEHGSVERLEGHKQNAHKLKNIPAATYSDP